MVDVKSGDRVGLGEGGAWWGFAFIVFIIFAIIIAFAWLHGKRDDGGWEKLLPFLGMLGLGKGHGSDHHTEIVKDFAKETGAIIHNADLRAYDLKASQDANTARLEKRIDDFRDEFNQDKIAELRAQLCTEKTCSAVDRSHEDLRHELHGMKGNFRPNWFHGDSKCAA